MPSYTNGMQWQSIGQAQAANFEFDHAENYYDIYTQVSKNPLFNVSPLTDNFFGPRILNILIITQLYGWNGEVFSWPPEGYLDSINKIIDNYEQWSKYNLFIYGDQGLIDKIAASADPDKVNLINKLEQTFAKLESECGKYAEYGFVWKGRVPKDADYTYFSEVLNDFYNESQPS
jgi:hypothetical protein